MSSSIGSSLTLSIFGQSHSAAIGCTLDGVPAGIKIDQTQLQTFCDRRAPGRDRTATSRREADRVRVLSGIVDNRTCGAPIALIIENTNTRSQDYAEIRDKPRPGHADWPARVRYGNWHDVAGGGHFSGRLTAPLTAAGGIAVQILEQLGVTVVAHILTLGPRKIADTPLDPLVYIPSQRDAILNNTLPCIDEACARTMRTEILSARDEQDSIGGVIECAAYGMPTGIGNPMFNGIENKIAAIAFGIPAVKGIEFGAGFSAAHLKGSQHNDSYAMVDGHPASRTNNAGGILGGITTGTPVTFRLCLKPTPSIGREQQTVNLRTMSDDRLSVRGRHDPCIVARAVPVVEAACAFALLDALLDTAAIRIAPHLDENPLTPTLSFSSIYE